jgi:hypothetical protein
MNTRALHPLSRGLLQTPLGPMRSPSRALGWFSIGLGIAELVMPRTMSRAAGMSPHPTLMRAYGLREIGVGIGLLFSRDPTPWLWGRVAGDALDLVTIGTGVINGRPARTIASLATIGCIMAVDAKVAVAASQGPRQEVRDYSARSGFPKPIDQMRGAALKKLEGRDNASAGSNLSAMPTSNRPDGLDGSAQGNRQSVSG